MSQLVASHPRESDLTGEGQSGASGILKPPGDAVCSQVGEVVGCESLLAV